MAYVLRRYAILDALRQTESAVGTLVGDSAASDADVGQVFLIATTQTPDSGAFVCNGQAIDRADFSELFDLVGTASPYGPGNGSSTFNVPDLTGVGPAGFRYVVRAA